MMQYWRMDNNEYEIVYPFVKILKVRAYTINIWNEVFYYIVFNAYEISVYNFYFFRNDIYEEYWKIRITICF